MKEPKGRVGDVFKFVRRRAAGRLPWLSKAKVRFCREADAAQRKTWRIFAHSNHHPMTACFARAAEKELTDLELLGMSAHELGHIVGEELGFPEHAKPVRGKGTPWRVQCEADWISRRVLGLKIRYNKRTLQELARWPR